MVLLNADKFNVHDDYCKLRDDRNDGWDVFYFGSANKEKFTKLCYVRSVNRGAHGEHRIYFTEEDSIKIMAIVKASNNTEIPSTLRID